MNGLRYYEAMKKKSYTKKPNHCSTLPLSERIVAISRWLEDHKAEDIVCLDLSSNNGFADAILVLTANSVRHAQSLADGIAELCHDQSYEFLRVEGRTAGQWILVDLNDLVINIFLGPVRELYKLETLWGKSSTRPEIAL